jgi:hypothetical protein
MGRAVWLPSSVRTARLVADDRQGDTETTILLRVTGETRAGLFSAIRQESCLTPRLPSDESSLSPFSLPQRFAKLSQGQKPCRGFKSRPLRHTSSDEL